MKKGTVYFKNKPEITSVFTVAGPKESEGPIGDFIEKKLTDDKYGEKTFEKAEKKILSEAIENVVKVSDKEFSDIDALIAGDLLNQIISSSFSARDFKIPFIGVYSACSTMSESIALAASFIDDGKMENVICATGSHFASAERQYRYPLELGSTRPPQSQWTVTGAGACIISKSEAVRPIAGSNPYIESATFGKVVDYGVTDANNMGAAMAPACADTMVRHFRNTSTCPDDYDLILSGDLGVLGSRILKDLVWEKGYDITDNHVDCGEMIYNLDEKNYQGGSGAGCSALVLNSYIYRRMREKRIKSVLFLATGALLSSVSSQQGESVPCISNAVVIKND